jgi:glutaconyl-CoA decarboxylase
VAEGIPPEIVAVIAAAVASYGYGVSQIHSIRPLERTGWKTAVRTQITQRV